MMTTQSDLVKWSEGLTGNAWRFCKQYPQLRDGINCFYGPVFPNPVFLILGIQPGGDYTNFEKENKFQYECGNFSLPKESLYITGNFRLKKQLHKVLSPEIIRQSVATNLNWFRAKDQDGWNKIEPELRKKCETFSQDVVKEIIQVLKPKAILLIGLFTWYRFNRFEKQYKTKPWKLPGDKYRYAITSQCANGTKVVAIVHLSGYRVSKSQINAIKSLLQTMTSIRVS